MKMMIKRVASLALVASLSVLSSCDYGEKDDEKKQENAALLVALAPHAMEINGTWSVFSETEIISAQASLAAGAAGTWVDSGSYGYTREVVEFDNATRTAYVRFPRQSWMLLGSCTTTCYGRRVWTQYQSRYYYCEVVYNKTSLAEAKADTATADATNPTTGGCNGYSWNPLVAQ